MRFLWCSLLLAALTGGAVLVTVELRGAGPRAKEAGARRYYRLDHHTPSVRFVPPRDTARLVLWAHALGPHRGDELLVVTETRDGARASLPLALAFRGGAAAVGSDGQLQAPGGSADVRPLELGPGLAALELFDPTPESPLLVRLTMHGAAGPRPLAAHRSRAAAPASVRLTELDAHEPLPVADDDADAPTSARRGALLVAAGEGAPVELALAESGGGVIRVELARADATEAVGARAELLGAGGTRFVIPLRLATGEATARRFLSYPAGATWLRLTAPTEARVAARFSAFGGEAEPWMSIAPEHLATLRRDGRWVSMPRSEASLASHSPGAEHVVLTPRDLRPRRLLVADRTGGWSRVPTTKPARWCTDAAAAGALHVRLAQPSRAGSGVVFAVDGALTPSRVLFTSAERLLLPRLDTGCRDLQLHGLTPHDRVLARAERFPEEPRLKALDVWRLAPDAPLRLTLPTDRTEAVTVTVYPDPDAALELALSVDDAAPRRHPGAATSFTPPQRRLAVRYAPSSAAFFDHDGTVGTPRRLTLPLGADLDAGEHSVTLEVTGRGGAWFRATARVAPADGPDSGSVALAAAGFIEITARGRAEAAR